MQPGQHARDLLILVAPPEPCRLIDVTEIATVRSQTRISSAEPIAICRNRRYSAGDRRYLAKPSARLAQIAFEARRT